MQMHNPIKFTILFQLFGCFRKGKNFETKILEIFTKEKLLEQKWKQTKQSTKKKSSISPVLDRPVGNKTTI